MSRRSLLFSAVGVAGALTLSACGSSSDDKGKGSGSKPSSKPLPKAGAIQINEQPRSALKQGGTLTWPLSEVPVNFNYGEIDGTLADGAAVINAVMPIIMKSDATGTVSPDPNYLASADVATTGGKQVVTYAINPKAKWSDGTAISYKDFAAQATALSGKDKKYKISSSTGYELIESVKKGKDDQEVVVTFTSAFGDWKSLFSPLYPASKITTPADFNDGWKNGFPLTAGPFKFQKIDQTAKTITLVRDDAWWGDKAILDRIIYRVLAEDAAVSAYVNGEIDFDEIGPTPAAYKQAKTAKAGEIREAAGPNFRHLTLNCTSGPLKELNVRKAIFMAINREAVAKSDLEGLNWAGTPLNNHLYVTNQKGYQDNAGELGKYNPDAAKKLLDEAGWKMSGSVRSKGGKQLAINITIPSDTAVSTNEANLIQAMLGAVGIKLTIKTVPLANFFDKYVTPGNFDLTVFSWLGTSFPISGSTSIYAKPEGDNIQQNYSRIGSDALDTLFMTAAGEPDQTKQAVDGNAADKAIWEQASMLTLYQRPSIVAAKKTLANFGAGGFRDNVYENIGFTA